MKKLVVGLAMVVATLGLGVGTAAAAEGPAYCGAMNMHAAVSGLGPGNGVGVQPGGGMVLAMTRHNLNGTVGMYHAVAVSCRP